MQSQPASQPVCQPTTTYILAVSSDLDYASTTIRFPFSFWILLPLLCELSDKLLTHEGNSNAIFQDLDSSIVFKRRKLLSEHMELSSVGVRPVTYTIFISRFLYVIGYFQISYFHKILCRYFTLCLFIKTPNYWTP